jgi:hypothetical protein
MLAPWVSRKERAPDCYAYARMHIYEGMCSSKQSQPRRCAATASLLASYF